MFRSIKQALGLRAFSFLFFSESPSNNSGLSSEQGTCSEIPSGLVIEMLVTEAGKYAGVPQMEVVGTKIR